MNMCSIRWITRNLDSIRIPLNGTEREIRKGDIPYWGANRIVDYVDEALLDERVVLIGEDGAPFFDPLRDVAFLSEGPIWPNNHIHILRADADKVDDVYLVYCLNAVDYSKYINGATRDKLTQFQLGSIKIPLPELHTQRAIARYLDGETRHIDDLIQEKSHFIDLLREKRAAKISRAVIQGLDSGVVMKASGVEWMGNIPEHWGAVRLGALFKEAARKGDPKLPVLSVSIHDGVSDVELGDEDRARKVALSEDRSVYQGVMPGDLVYNMMRAWQGGFGAVSTEGLISPAYVVAQPISDARTKFIELQLRTPQAVEEMRRYSKGIADFRLRLYWEHFRNVRVALPPLEEQDKILAEIDRESSRIDGLISETERSIALLKEKRSALITAAVTGKIDVRSAA